METRSPTAHFTCTLDVMFDPVLTTQAQLEDAWRELMGPWSFGRHSVWMLFICDDRPLRQLTEIADIADPPDSAMLDGLARNLEAVEREVAPGMRVAFLRSRPGRDTITDNDRAWARSLYAAARRAGMPCEVVHLATRGVIRPIPADVVGIR